MNEIESLPLLLLIAISPLGQLLLSRLSLISLPVMGRNRPSELDQRCLPAFNPVLGNEYGQSPCTVARILIDLPQCQWQDDAYYNLPPLDLDHGQWSYIPPDPFQVRCRLSAVSVGRLGGRENRSKGGSCGRTSGTEALRVPEWVLPTSDRTPC